MLSRFLPGFFLAVFIAGCAAPPQPPMTLDNPTDANAVEAPLPPPSATLKEDMSPDTQPADSMGRMHMHGDGGDMKGMDMKQGDQLMPGMQPGSTSRRSQ